MKRAGWALVAVGVLGRGPVAAQEACTTDPRLTEAAAELLLARNERPSAQALGSAVRAAGSEAVGVHALFMPADAPQDSAQRWLASVRARVDGAPYCGRADSAAGRLLIVAGRGATLEPIDARTRIVRGQLEPGFRDAELVIETGDQQLIRVGVSPEALSKGVALEPALSLPLKVQLVARGRTGPRPVAERELRESVDAPELAAEGEARARRAQATRDLRAESAAVAAARTRPELAHATPQTSGELERGGAAEGRTAWVEAATATGAQGAAVASRTRQPGESAAEAARPGDELSRALLALRGERGRGGLRSNRLLREAASRHAEDVCAKGRVAHEVEAGVGPDERLARAGLDARVLGEAIARADSSDSALDALKNSPSHLYTLLDPRFTDFGIGVAQDGAQKYCFVVLLCAWPRYVGKRR